MDINEIRRLSNISHNEWSQVRSKFCKMDLKKKINKEEYEKDLLDIKRVLDEYDLKVWLIFGTLLGAVRDNDFLEWDDNINMAVYEEEFERAMTEPGPS